MGMLGDLIYPDNSKMAADLNQKYQQMLDNNSLQNNLVNSYHDLAATISTFDAYLMALACMQYQISYDDEKLANLPPTDIPKLSQSIADRIEACALEGIAAAQTLQGLNAMRKGVVNLYRNAGTYKSKIGEGYDSFKNAMQNGLDRARFKIQTIRSGNVSALTEENINEWNDLNGELTAEGKIDLMSEEDVNNLKEVSGDDEWDVVDIEIEAEVETTSTGVEIGEEAAEETAAEGASAIGEAVSTFGEAASAILGPAMVVLVVVTEIIGLVEAGKMNEKLKECEANMDNTLAKQKKSLDSTRKAFGNLLDCAIDDINEFNEVIKDMIGLAPSKATFFEGYPGYNTLNGFAHNSLDAYKQAVGTVMDEATITDLQTFSDSDIAVAKTCISDLSIQESADTQAITSIKKWLKANNCNDITPAYSQEIMDVYGLTQERVAYCNAMRKYLNEIAERLAPYHKAISDMPQKSGTKTQQPTTDPMNHTSTPSPTYDADPSDFTMPPS